jgi:hypothetical protein
MLAGVPVHYALVLVGLAVVLGVGLVPVSKLLGFGVMALVLFVWGGLSLVFAQDRVQVPLFFLRRRYRFAARITSFSPSYQSVRVANGHGDER